LGPDRFFAGTRSRAPERHTLPVLLLQRVPAFPAELRTPLERPRDRGPKELRVPGIELGFRLSSSGAVLGEQMKVETIRPHAHPVLRVSELSRWILHRFHHEGAKALRTAKGMRPLR